MAADSVMMGASISASLSDCKRSAIVMGTSRLGIRRRLGMDVEVAESRICIRCDCVLKGQLLLVFLAEERKNVEPAVRFDFDSLLICAWGNLRLCSLRRTSRGSSERKKRTKGSNT